MVICNLFGKGVEYLSSAIPKIAPASKTIGISVELGCEISSEIGKRIINKLKDEELTTQPLKEFKSQFMSYPDSRQQRNIMLNKQKRIKEFLE